jgi:hypothetical protein
MTIDCYNNGIESITILRGARFASGLSRSANHIIVRPLKPRKIVN